jgi:hypothetical protein
MDTFLWMQKLNSGSVNIALNLFAFDFIHIMSTQGLTNLINDITGKIEGIKGEIEGIEGEIKVINNKVITLYDNVEGLEKQVIIIDNKTAGYLKELEDTNTQIEALMDEVYLLENVKQNLGYELNVANAKLTSVNNAIMVAYTQEQLQKSAELERENLEDLRLVEEFRAQEQRELEEQENLADLRLVEEFLKLPQKTAKVSVKSGGILPQYRGNEMVEVALVHQIHSLEPLKDKEVSDCGSVIRGCEGEIFTNVCALLAIFGALLNLPDLPERLLDRLEIFQAFPYTVAQELFIMSKVGLSNNGEKLTKEVIDKIATDLGIRVRVHNADEDDVVGAVNSNIEVEIVLIGHHYYAVNTDKKMNSIINNVSTVGEIINTAIALDAGAIEVFATNTGKSLEEVRKVLTGVYINEVEMDDFSWVV